MTVHCEMFDILYSYSIAKWENNSTFCYNVPVLAALYKSKRRVFIANIFSFKITIVALPRIPISQTSDTSLRRRVRSGLEGDHLREIWRLCQFYMYIFIATVSFLHTLKGSAFSNRLWIFSLSCWSLSCCLLNSFCAFSNSSSNTTLCRHLYKKQLSAILSQVKISGLSRLPKSVPVVLDLPAAGCSVQLLPPERNMLSTWQTFESVQRTMRWLFTWNAA